jgi:hypothetical protein
LVGNLPLEIGCATTYAHIIIRPDLILGIKSEGRKKGKDKKYPSYLLHSLPQIS